ncbi:Hypothetical protein LUCI_1177 [Lucifera butyrica]|uniref:Uncharacterized protein n=1 Tax=Lucifera butyrica TaxID=1351585 RepID=A0A498R0D3_9FIRM|nr:Hypothetical protein LUCI_1177 [Lucifera butyrica]
MKVQTWLCPECGIHGAEAEIEARDVLSEAG